MPPMTGSWRFILVLATAVACGGPPFSVDSDDVEPLRWSIGPQTLRYHVAQSLRVRVEAEDGRTTGDWRRSEFATLVEMGPPDARGRAQVTVTYDALRGEVDDPSGSYVFDGAWEPSAADRTPRAARLREMRRLYLDDAYSYSVDARGDIDVIRAGQTSLGEAWPDWIGPLPDGPAKPGDSWRREVIVERPLVGRLRAITTMTLGENQRYGLLACALIKFETRYAWLSPDDAPNVGVDPEALRDEGTLCFGFNGIPLQQTTTATRRGNTEAGEVTVEYTQTRSWIPSTGPIPWTIEVPASPPPSAPAAATPLSVVAPTLPEGALRRLGSAQGTFWSRIDDVEPAPTGAQIAVASGPSITLVDGATGARTDAIMAPCTALADIVWGPDGLHLVGLCAPDKGTAGRGIHVWRVADGVEVQSIDLPVEPARISVGKLEGRPTGFAVDVRGGLWRFDLLSDAAPQAIALAWPATEPDEAEADGGVGEREDGGVYPEPNDPLEFSRFVVAPDGFHAAGVADGRLVLVDAGAQQVRRVMTDPETVVRDLVWLPQRPGAFVLAVDNRLEIWSADDDGPLPDGVVELAGPAWEGAERLSISADGKRLLAWQDKQGASLWRVVGDKLVADVMAIDARAEAVMTADARIVVSRSRHANVLHLFDLAKGKPLRLSGAHGERIIDLAVAPDGAHVATADLNGWVQVWNVADGAAGARFRVESAPQRYGDVLDTFVAFAGADRLLVGHPLGGGFRDLDGRRARAIEENFWTIERVRVDTRGRRALTLKHGFGGVSVWSLEGTPHELWGERGEAHNIYAGGAYVCGAALARGGSRVALQWSDGRVEVRSIDGGRVDTRAQAEPSHCQPALSGDGQRLAFIDPETAAIRVVDLAGKTVAELPGSRSILYGALVLDEDGDRLVAARGRSLWLFGLGEKTTTRARPVPEGDVALIAPIGEALLVTTTAQGTSALIWPWE